jgi:uncharacterized protein involved in exopolysaccharide biosynthesis
MNNNLENEELTIDFAKLWKIILYRKTWIISCFILVALITTFLTLTYPKKYTVNAKILINKSSSTNLADINPFIVSDISASSGFSGMLGGLSSNLNNEIEILKSPLVIESVIKENDLKYANGPKKGEYLSTNDFLGKNIIIENLKGSNIISISYKSSKRELAYSAVNSIIKYYKDIYETINSNKASKDTSFLEKSYLDTQKTVNQKISKIKNFSEDNNTGSTVSGNLSNILLRKYDRRIGDDLGSASKDAVENKKLETDLDMELEKLKMLKQKYEWSSLVENMSKNTSNMIVLKYPELPESYEYKKPNLQINIIIALIAAFSLSSIAIFILEKADKKLTYSALDEKSIILNKSNNIDIYDIKTNAFLKNAKHIGLISLAKEGVTQEFANLVSQSLRNTDIKINLSKHNSPMDQHIQNIVTSEYVVFLTQLNHTDKKIYLKLNDLCKKANKDYLTCFATFDLAKIKNTEADYSDALIR